MKKIKYDGPLSAVTILGVTFKKGDEVNVDESCAKVALERNGFLLVVDVPKKAAKKLFAKPQVDEDDKPQVDEDE